jgi:CheY-like chemotaxis protein
MKHLFEEFVQFDPKRNRSIEGTGLGLAISRKLCRLMGGDILVASKYGQGSVFTAIISQQVKDKTPFAAVNDPGLKQVLVFEEHRNSIVESLRFTIEKMGMPFTLAQSTEEFSGLLGRKTYGYILVNSRHLDEVRLMLKNTGSNAVLVLLTEFGEMPPPDIQSLALPVQPRLLANIFNGVRDEENQGRIKKQSAHFIAPGARVLIVDDITTNLNVAEGLLKPYKLKIDCCVSGAQALDLAREHRYDLILMDQMMPGMDGIEAAAKIREQEKGTAGQETPIIALTANAVSGMREMFLEKGFNDYLSKPIDITKLDELMDKWIPKEKQIVINEESERQKGDQFQEESALQLPSLNVVQGINRTGGTEEGYRQVLRSFYRDAGDRLVWFGSFSPDGESLDLFATHVHALKSASGTIGAAELSAEAAALESAGKEGNRAFIREKLSPFCERLGALVSEIGKALALAPVGTPATAAVVIGPELKEMLIQLRDALSAKNMGEIDRLIAELEDRVMDTAFRDTIGDFSDRVLVGEYAKVIKAINDLTGSLT